MKSQFNRFLCWFLAALMLVMPSSQLLAQDADEALLADPAIVPVPDVIDTPLDVTYLLPQSCFVMSVRPQAILNSPMMKMMPIEVLQAASIQQTGIDALLMDQLLLSIEPPVGGPPNYAAMASFTAPVAGKLHPQITATLEHQDQSSRPHFKGQNPFDPSLYFPSNNVLLATPEATLQKFLVGGTKPTDASLHERLLAAKNDDFYLAVDFVPLRPMANMLLVQTPIPPQLHHFYVAPDLIKTIELRLNISHPGTNELVIESNNAEDAEELEQLVLKSVDMIRSEVAKEVAQLKSNPDPVQQALGRYQERMMTDMSTAFLPKRDGEKLIVFRTTGPEGQLNTVAATAVTGVLVALLLPAVQAAREAARRTSSMNNVKQIMLAFHNYHDSKKAFPAHANYKEGKPLLSWRVHILPYMEQQALYNQFHLDEPWDSEHNKTLIRLMPVQYIDPSSTLNPAEGRTHYLGVKGAGSLFNGTDKGTTMKQITDGTSNTIAVLQVNDDRATTWTKPDDWEPDAKDPLKGLAGSMHPSTFIAGYADGHVMSIHEGIDQEVFKKLLTIAGGEVIETP